MRSAPCPDGAGLARCYDEENARHLAANLLALTSWARACAPVQE